MFKRIVAALLSACFLCLLGCSAQEADGAPPTDDPRESVTPQTKSDESGKLLGFVIEDDGALSSYMAMHGFLHTAENLCIPAKLYRAKSGAEAVEAVKQAAAEGCDALLIRNRNGENDEAVALSISLGIRTAVPYDACSIAGLDVNVTADESEYTEDLARGLADRLRGRDLKSGRILVYGEAADVEACYAAFETAIKNYYPQYTLQAYIKTGTDQAALEELTQYLLYNRDVKGMYVATASLATIVVEARNTASRLFRTNGTPSATIAPSETNALAAEGQPAATPNPALLTQISITVFATGISDENLALFNGSDIYALCIEPYYDASAQAVMLLDRLLSGGEAAKNSRVNRPIVYAETIDRYLAIYQQAKEMFGF